MVEWRSTFKASVPEVPVEPLCDVFDEVQPCWDSIDAAFPFVFSIRDKCHRVEVGYPNHPSTWRSKCGWAFGFRGGLAGTKFTGLPQIHMRPRLQEGEGGSQSSCGIECT